MSRPSDPTKPTVLIPARFRPLMSLVTRAQRSNQAVFSNAYDLVCFAAAVGFYQHRTGTTSRRSADKAEGGEVVMQDPARQDRILCDMIAISVKGSDEILQPGRLQERLDLFMQYACGGMEYLLELAETRTARAAVETIIRGTDQDESVAELSKAVAFSANP